jgi:hypothetical protein
MIGVCRPAAVVGACVESRTAVRFYYSFPLPTPTESSFLGIYFKPGPASEVEGRVQRRVRLHAFQPNFSSRPQVLGNERLRGCPINGIQTPAVDFQLISVDVHGRLCSL